MNSAPSQAKQIFLDAVDRYAPHQWPGYLDGACGEDTELRRRVEALLEAHVADESLLDEPAIELEATIDHSQIAERPGAEIGPYRLIEQIGEGGFGVVFLAEQTEPVRREVALKVVKAGMGTKEVVARFEAERQALAMMDHPNIAKVLGSGATESGRPYFVMELVRGIPITEYCDQCKLTTRERLDLFVLVCQAVQHAHQKGVIHRDLKPSNVLIAMQDGRPVPKIIDFGVAKAVNQRLTEHTLKTRFAQILGTPLYMSPEQAELSPLGVDTRSDIYSLGVLLYELLTGTTPFDKDRLYSASFDELRQIIRTEEPPRPSTRLSTLAAEMAATVADRHRTDARHLQQTIRGDLDWLVMKAMEKDRSRRYESASSLARDIDRYLADEPVEACPPSAAYRLRKFVRRNRAVVLTAGLVLSTLLVGIAGTSWQAVRATSERNQKQNALDERNIVIREKDDALAQANANLQLATTQRIRADANKRMALTSLGNLRIDMRDYEFFLQPEGGTSRKLKLMEIPIMRRDTGDDKPEVGTVYLWTDGGRPEVIIDEFMYINEFERIVRTRHEIHSLAVGPLKTTYQGVPVWNPVNPGIMLQEIPDAPQPATSAADRILQMQQLAGLFNVWIGTEGHSLQLDLKPDPIYRYELKKAQPLDGALFAFLQIADLEVLLVIEARGQGNEAKWYFAFAALTNQDASAVHRGRQVWQAPPYLHLNLEDSLHSFNTSDQYVHLNYVPTLLSATASLKMKAKYGERLATILEAMGRHEDADKEFNQVIESYQRLLEERPSDLSPQIRLGYLFATKRDWRTASACLAHVAEEQPEMLDRYDWYFFALCCLGASDFDNYKQACHALFEHYQDEKADGLFLTAWTCSLTPNSKYLVDDVIAAGKAASESDTGKFNAQCYGASLVRSGRYEEGIRVFDKLVADWDEQPSRQNLTSPAYNWFFLAIAHHHLGNADMATQCYAHAVSQMKKELSDALDSRQTLSWERQLTFEILQRETSRLLDTDETQLFEKPTLTDEDSNINNRLLVP
jgi:serine/threonine protein kinase